MKRAEVFSQFQKDSQQLLEDLKSFQVKKVILHGSFARGDYNEVSDIDIVIVKETEKRFTDRIGDVLKIYRGSLAIEPLVYTPQEFEKMESQNNPFIQQVLSEGKVLYEQK